VHQAEVSDLHEAMGDDMVQGSGGSTRRHRVGSYTRSCPAGCTSGAGHGAVREGDEAALGDGDPDNRGGEVCAGCGPVRVGLPRDLPVGMPDLGIDGVEQTGIGHIVLQDGVGDGREGVHGDQEVVSGREPRGTVPGEAATRDDGVEVRVRRELPAPGMQDPGQARAIGADATRICGEACAGRCGGGDQGLRGWAWMGAEEGSSGLRDGGGDEAMRSGGPLVQRGLEPALRCLVLPLGAGAVAAGMVDTVRSATAWAPRAAVSVVSRAAMGAGGNGLVVRERPRGKRSRYAGAEACKIAWMVVRSGGPASKH
jgi:hypothetical protein